MPIIQSILFDKSMFDTLSSKKWMREHGVEPIKRVHKTPNFLRYRLKNPPKNKEYVTVEYEKGVKLVLVY